MTATRWWVKLIARWLARVDSVKGQVQMFSLAVTAFSTFSIMLQGFGLGRYVPYLGAIAGVSILAYSFLFFEGGVWNQVSRDRQDMSNNFAGPSMRIDDTLIGVSVFSAVHGRPPNEDELEMIERAVSDQWEQYRDGVDLE